MNQLFRDLQDQAAIDAWLARNEPTRQAPAQSDTESDAEAIVARVASHKGQDYGV